MRIVFLGSDPIARPLLDWLVTAGRGAGELVGVFTQPDRPVGRGQQVMPNAIKTWAGQRGLPVRQPEKLTESARAELAELAPDLALVMAYGHILKDDFIATPRLGTINLHASLLPWYRGASPIQSAIASGEKETGVTLMRIVRALDAGPVADRETVPIHALDTAAVIEERLAQACPPLLARCLPRLANGTLDFTEQDHTRATYCRRLVKADGGLDFHQPAALLAARINGLHPWPGCSITVREQVIKLGQADAVDGEGEPGVVVGGDEHGLLVGTSRGRLRLRRLQRAGGRMLEATEFLRGFPLPAGTRLPSQPMPVLVANRPLR
jgi:methionyl-tRNA formyltransferase